MVQPDSAPVPEQPIACCGEGKKCSPVTAPETSKPEQGSYSAGPSQATSASELTSTEANVCCSDGVKGKKCTSMSAGEELASAVDSCCAGPVHGTQATQVDQCCEKGSEERCDGELALASVIFSPTPN